MSKKTITVWVRKANTPQKRAELIVDWLNAWEKEQSELAMRMDLAADSGDFDLLCIAVGQLKAVTEKKFTAFYNILREINLEDNFVRDWNKQQNDVVFSMGRHVAGLIGYDLGVLSAKLHRINADRFSAAKNIIIKHLRPQKAL